MFGVEEEGSGSMLLFTRAFTYLMPGTDIILGATFNLCPDRTTDRSNNLWYGRKNQWQLFVLYVDQQGCSLCDKAHKLNSTF